MILSIDGNQFEIGIFEAQEAMERAETDVKLQSTAPTIELLSRVAAWSKSRFGVTLSLTAAWQLWWAICELLEVTRKRHQRIADVGAWLHIDATQLGEDQLFGLLENVPRVKAQHQLQSGQFDPTNYEGVYSLVLLATGNEEQAREAKTQALERLVDSRCGGK